MDDCLVVLETEGDELDQVLVGLVKIQHVGHETFKLLSRDMACEPVAVPTYIQKKPLLQRLEGIRNQIPAHISSSCE